MSSENPIVAVTMGDPCGVGPEILLKAWDHDELFMRCQPVVVGDAKVLRRAQNYVSSKLRVEPLSSLSGFKASPGTIHCIDLDVLPKDLPVGRICAEAGRAAYLFIEKAVHLALSGEVAAVCTGPLNKAALKAGGCDHPGHTEILADLSGTKEYAMMLSAPDLKVVHVTTHMGLIDAIDAINAERVWSVIAMTQRAMAAYGVEDPRIAVAAINPHAGEDGLFGRGEEEQKVLPALERAKKQGIKVEGPIPADTVFFRAVRGEYDVVIAMYHDQGHIPVKVLGFEAGVNITIGLPFIRTSVDHGTAFDIAGTGRASEQSLMEALKHAAVMAARAAT